MVSPRKPTLCYAGISSLVRIVGSALITVTVLPAVHRPLFVSYFTVKRIQMRVRAGSTGGSQLEVERFL